MIVLDITHPTSTEIPPVRVERDYEEAREIKNFYRRLGYVVVGWPDDPAPKGPRTAGRVRKPKAADFAAILGNESLSHERRLALVKELTARLK